MQMAHLRPALLLGCVIPLLLISIAAAFPGFFDYFETRLGDLYFASKRESPALPTVAIVGFDDDTLEHFDWRARLDHRHHAKLVRQLQKMGARTVAFDFAFLRPDATDIKQHDVFAKACSGYGKVVIGAIVTESANDTLGPVKEPIPQLVNAVNGLGILFHPLDTDSVIRRATLRFPSGKRTFNALALQAFLTAEELKAEDIKTIGNIVEITYGADKMPIDVSDEGTILISYAGPAGTVDTYSYVNVLKGEVPKDAFRDRVVFVGPTAKIFQDYRQVPTFSKGIGVASTMTGVEIHANTYITLAEGLNGRGFLHKMAPYGVAGITMGCALLTALSCAFLEIYLSWIVLLSLLPAYFILSHYFLLVQQRVLPPFILPCAAIVLSYLAVLIHRYLEERRRRRHVRSMFEHFVPTHVVARLEKDPELLQAPGRERELSVLFSDIRSFTSISEKIGAEKTVRMLNRYFEVMTEVILKHDGMVDKFIGDAILAVFGEPVSKGNHAQQAVMAALDMRKALEELNKDEEFRALIDEPNGLDSGIAINTGPMFVGNLGALKRKDYTVIGDAVNLCSRLEGLARDENPRVIISEYTFEETKKLIDVKSLGEVTVKGKSVPVVAYGVLGAARLEEAAE